MDGARKLMAQNTDGQERLLKLHGTTSEMLGKAEKVDDMANEGFVDELRHVVATYISEAVTSIEIPPIQGSKDWGDFEITGAFLIRLLLSLSLSLLLPLLPLRLWLLLRLLLLLLLLLLLWVELPPS